MRTSLIEAYKQQEKAAKGMQKTIENLSYDKIDVQATKKKIVDKELSAVKKATQQAAKSAMNSDPRQAFKAVRITKYKRIFGGNVNILSPRKGATYVVGSPLTYRRRNRYISSRTKQLYNYAGQSRSFVLRFIEGGTQDRIAGSKGNKRGGHGNRGKIKARDFMATAQTEMGKAPQHIIDLISQITEQQFEKN